MRKARSGSIPPGRDGHARRHGVAAAGDEQAMVLGGEDRGAEVDPADRAARALAAAVLILGDDDRRAAEAFLQAAGDDPDHAGMPAAPRDDHQRRVGLGVGLLARLLR